MVIKNRISLLFLLFSVIGSEIIFGQEKGLSREVHDKIFGPSKEKEALIRRARKEFSKTPLTKESLETAMDLLSGNVISIGTTIPFLKSIFTENTLHVLEEGKVLIALQRGRLEENVINRASVKRGGLPMKFGAQWFLIVELGDKGLVENSNQISLRYASFDQLRFVTAKTKSGEE